MAASFASVIVAAGSMCLARNLQLLVLTPLTVAFTVPATECMTCRQTVQRKEIFICRSTATDEDKPSLDVDAEASPRVRSNGKVARTGTVNKRLLKAIDAELKVVQDRKIPPPQELSEEDTDLNGINPIQPFGAAVFSAILSLLFWRITIGLAAALNNVHLDTELYPVQRLFSIASTAFVGITALGAGVVGFTALGLLGLALRVTLGVASGELDPNKQRIAPPRSPIPLDKDGLPQITGAWYDVKPPVQRKEGPASDGGKDKVS